MNQTELAGALGISQDAISRWERGAVLPPLAAVRAIGKLISPDSRNELYKAAGIEDDAESLLLIESETRRIPLISDSNQLGSPQAQMAGSLVLPSEWLPQDANIKAARFQAKISPLFEGELIALVDTRYRDPDRLQGCIVVARTPVGAEPMRLRSDGPLHFLIPLRTDGDQSVHRVQSDGDWSIVGKVLKWIGDAPSARK